MFYKIKTVSLLTVSLMLAVSQVLFQMALLSGGMPFDSLLGTSSQWVSASLWALFLLVGWGGTNMTDSSEVIPVIAMTVCGIITIASAIAYIPILAQIGYALNIVLWALSIMLMCDDIFAF